MQHQTQPPQQPPMMSPQAIKGLQSLVAKFQEWREHPEMFSDKERHFFSWVLNPASVPYEWRYRFETNPVDPDDPDGGRILNEACIEFVRRIRGAQMAQQGDGAQALGQTSGPGQISTKAAVTFIGIGAGVAGLLAFAGFKALERQDEEG